MYHRAFHRAGILAFAVALCVATGCDRGQTRSDDTRTQRTDESQPSEDLLASKGEDCSRDPDCSGYLRCLDGTCRIPPAVEGRRDEQTPVVTLSPPAEANAEPVDFYVELATNADQRRRGLMFRENMADGWGMLFVYPDEAQRSFWMKNTYIPLDMVFLDGAGRVVNVVTSAEPQTLTARRSADPARFVLEVNAGTASDAGIGPGWTMSVEHVPEAHSPER